MRGYFGVGSERISKPMNLGAVLRTGHAFGASFAFTIGSPLDRRSAELADTSKSAGHMPFYQWATVGEMVLPKECVLVGVELDERAVDLPAFRHPLKAAYILGPEKGDLSDEAKAACAHLVKIPMRFCVNLSVAAALVMYDSMLTLGGYERGRVPEPASKKAAPASGRLSPSKR